VPRSVRSLSESIPALFTTTAPSKELLGLVGQFVHETVNLVERFVKPTGRHGVVMWGCRGFYFILARMVDVDEWCDRDKCVSCAVAVLMLS